MKSPDVCIIAAVSENLVIGRDNGLPWKIPADLQRFRRLTLGHPVIMGRKTYDSLLPESRPLPDRQNIVVTTNKGREIPGCRVAHSLDEAVKVALALDAKRVCVIGGGQIYRQAIGFADRLFLTLIRGEFEGDTFFPDYANFNKKVSEESGRFNGFEYTFLELLR